MFLAPYQRYRLGAAARRGKTFGPNCNTSPRCGPPGAPAQDDSRRMAEAFCARSAVGPGQPVPHPLCQDPWRRVSIADVGPWQGVPPSVRSRLNRAGIVITRVLHGPDDAAIGVPEGVAEA